MGLIQNITSMGLPTNSYIRAVQQFNELVDSEGNLAIHRENGAHLLKLLFDKELKALEGPQGRIQAAYIIQEAVRSYANGEIVDEDMIYLSATKKAQIYCENHPWIFAVKEVEQKVDANGAPKPKKGRKQEQAAEIYQANKGKDKKDIIDLFVKEVGLTPAGASTYFYNMKKKFG